MRAERLRRLSILQKQFDALPVDDAVAISCGRLAAAVADAGRQPRRRATDLLIAATQRIDTSPNPVYDLAEPSQVWSLYSAVVRDGLPREQVAILDRATLLALWTDLNLPTRCRAIWEDKFPELAEPSRTKAS